MISFSPQIPYRVAVEVATHNNSLVIGEPARMSGHSFEDLSYVILLFNSADRACPDRNQQKVQRTLNPNRRNPFLGGTPSCLQSPRACGQYAESLVFVLSPPASCKAVILASKNRLPRALWDHSNIGSEIVQ